ANQRPEVSSRTRLVTQNVQRKTNEMTAGRHIGTIGGFGGDGAELLAETQGIARVARGEAMGVECVGRSQPAPRIVHDLAKLESLRQDGAHLLASAERMQVDLAKREIHVHVAAWIGGHLPEACDGLLDSCTAFRQERQLPPQRYGGRGE